jgi:hypothetical protein
VRNEGENGRMGEWEKESFKEEKLCGLENKKRKTK